MYPKISFITVVRNNAEALRTTLDNLCSINYSSIEIIVIDGQSTDGTVAVAAQFAHSLAYFVSEPDGGIYFAMNKGLRAATGDYVWFINAGDQVVDFDALYWAMVSESPLADIYYGDTQIVSASGELLGLRRKPLPNTLTCRSLRKGMVVSHQAFIVRRAIAPAYDTQYRYSADYKWVYQCLSEAKTIERIDAVLAQFELGGATTVHHKESLYERFSIMRGQFGLMQTLVSHLKFCFDAIFRPTYR